MYNFKNTKDEEGKIVTGEDNINNIWKYIFRHS